MMRRSPFRICTAGPNTSPFCILSPLIASPRVVMSSLDPRSHSLPTRRSFIKTGAFLAGSIGLTGASAAAAQAVVGGSTPLRVVIIGLTHGHVNGMLRGDRTAMDIVGIYEPNGVVVAKYRERFQLPADRFFSDLPAMLDAVRPQAAWVFTDTFGHLAAVEACAPRGVHVMVEKPLAVSVAHARRMAGLARQHRIHVLTNLETTWYPSFHDAYRLAVTEGALGPITRIVGHFGHPGPAEINVPPEFLTWLTDPERNGGGASADFGCYGANLATWLLGNRRPLAVTAVFQTNKPATYRHVDDQATLILEYAGTQVIVQASWDWTFARKDLEIYGRKGVIRTHDTVVYDLQTERRSRPTIQRGAALPEPLRDTIEYFTAVIRGTHTPGPDLSSLENNLIATEILEAARTSAREGRRVTLSAAD
jgi:predicted dehydrogenase